MKLAILGGSFNPVHQGHLFLADTVLSVLGYDRIILVPAHTSPFKPGAPGASPKDRLDMLIASIPGDPRLTVDNCEIRREGVSYTIDTITDIEERYRPEGKLGLILGDDLARDFPKWRKAEELASRTDIIIARRLAAGNFAGDSGEEIPFPYPHKWLRNEIMDISSGALRDRIQNKTAWRSLVPPGARVIIEDRGLYGFSVAQNTEAPQEISRETITVLENTVRTMVTPSRFLHSRNTALLTGDLCARFGLDPKAGYLAGITHDMCKSLSEDELIGLAKKDGGRISKLEKKKPSLFHGRAAAVLLRERFGIHNRDILEAVRLHTMAETNMGPLAKALYIADKIEVSRERISPKLRDIEKFTGLESLFTAVLEETVAYLRSHEMDLSQGTLRLLGAIQKRRTF